MDHFQYRGGHLFAEDVPLTDIAEQVGTPVYVYSTATLERHVNVFRDAFEGLDALICYAVKANSNQAVLKTLARAGTGADVVSLGELRRALAAGIPADKIVFAGVGKTPEEMAAGLDAGILQFNVESAPELEMLNTVAGQRSRTAPVSLRVNPDVDAKTHAKISTGRSENKFGISWTQVSGLYDRIRDLPHLEAVGVDVHIGSQLTALDPLKAAFTKVVSLVRSLRQNGHVIRHIDLGGGLGIPYEPGSAPPPLPSDYGRMVRETLGGLDCRIILEPGRLIAGNAGILLTKLLYDKHGDERRFYIVDAAMNDLSRPAMYEAYHDIVPVNDPSGTERIPVDIVGPVCESGDTFTRARPMPVVRPGELLAIKSAGAYGAVMSGTYNSRPLVPEVLVNGTDFHVIRPRQTLDDLLALDRTPDWLAD
ncbi:diaminopimelate decarboxylase [Eilatimonas milleporae]|uniref:Diaminopimelate decarboxylase n=1 Tax=Eilatimonas milleporae TaxID=911205 RepID=A0A3M0BYQ8_9PROT|nr:diaminopimelate decarboxylase [Eilatimonas milleporae]RMB02701.1 diaminopimelate decarboxylase [Eilatimonas milleporae]